MSEFKNRIFALGLLIFSVMFFSAGSAFAEVKFGLLPRLKSEVMYGMFKPLAEYLTKETGEKVSIIVPKDFDTYKEAVRTGQIDIGFSNPLVYVQLKAQTNLDVLALSSEQKAGTKFRGIIIARKDSGINTVNDLKGKRLVFVEKDSAAGYIFQMLYLKKTGFDIKKDFITLPFAMKHDNVTMAVINKTADAGGIREDDLEKMKNRVELSEIKIVAYTEYFPNWPMYASPRLNKNTAKKIKEALLKLKPNETESERILAAARLTGFTMVSDKDYDQLRQAARLVGAL